MRSAGGQTGADRAAGGEVAGGEVAGGFLSRMDTDFSVQADGGDDLLWNE